MASYRQRGVTFSLPVKLTTKPKTAINDQQREQIFNYIKSQLPLFQKHLRTVEEIDFVDVISITKDAKKDIKLELDVFDQNGLDKFFQYSKYLPKDQLNGISFCLSTFFQNQEMPLKCGFQSTTKIQLLVQMPEKERKKMSAELSGRETDREYAERSTTTTTTRSSSSSSFTHPASSSKEYARDFDRKPVRTMVNELEQQDTRHSSITIGANEQASQIRRTFIINVPEKDVISVHIRSHSLENMNREMFSQGQDIYATEVGLPMHYDPEAQYWYEIHFKKYVLYFFNYTKEISTNEFKIGEKIVNRDILWGIASIKSHLNDIVKDRSGCFNKSELVMQIEDVCSNIQYSDLEEFVHHFLNSDIMHSRMYRIRFAFALGYLCRDYFYILKKTIDANTAHEIIDALLLEKLSDYPTSCLDYMPLICKHLLKIAYGENFCAVLYLSRTSSFIPENMLLPAFQDVLKSETCVNANQSEDLSQELCDSFLNKYLKTGGIEFKDILECLFRHLPLEMALNNSQQLNNLFEKRKLSEREEDALAAITASIKSQILSFASRNLKEKNVGALLKMATIIGRCSFCKDEKIRDTFEEGVISCFSWHFLQETWQNQELKDFLNFSGCFQNVESQIKLLKSLVESNTSRVRRLFVLLNEDGLLTEAFGLVETDVFRSWMQNEIKLKRRAGGDEILLTFQSFCDIMKMPVSSKREEVRQTLMCLTQECLRKYTLKQMLHHKEKIEQLCEKEPVVSSLYEEHLQELVRKKGLLPSEMLHLFSTYGTLRVNSRTTTDIVNFIIDLFFKESVQSGSALDIFLNQIQHVAFWEFIDTGEGSRIHTVKDNQTFKQVMLCVKKVTHLLKDHKVDLAFLSKINIKDEKTMKLLQLGGMKRKDVETLHSIIKKKVEEAKRTIEIIHIVLEKVQNKTSQTIMPDLTAIVDRVKEMDAKIKTGNLSLKKITSNNLPWLDLEELPAVCTTLYPVIESAVFWNVSKECTLKAFAKYLQSPTPLDGLVSVRYLFDFDTLTESMQEIENACVEEIQNTEKILKYLWILREEGMNLFQKSWESLEMDDTLPLQSVQTMFQNANVKEEISIADKVLSRPVSRSVTKTLSQLSRKNEVLETAEAVTAFLEALGYSISNDAELHSALQSFHELVNQAISKYTLNDIQIALKTIFELADQFTDVTVSIMSEIGKASLLIDFLREIAIEDVRNLIDAVEDISESHVQESTVSALIEVRRFIQPLINPLQLHEKGCHWIFQTLQKQASSLGKNADSFPEKVSDCCLHLHNLKSLYNNVANRGQQTKEIIKSIITKAKFAFILCSEKDQVTFEVSYKENKNKFKKQEAAVTDIRSRALLLLNTERSCVEGSFNQDEFKVFVDYVDLSFEIRETLNDLYASGHMQYKSFRLSLVSSELLTTKERLKKELDEWMKTLELVRHKHYLMNFIQGYQIRLLSDFLENGNAKEMAEAVLKFIHPYFMAQTLSDTFQKKILSSNAFLVLEELGRSLHEMYSHVSFYFREMICEDTTTKITQCVQKGKLLVAQLDENSEFVIRTILALYRNTSHCYPEPSQLLLCTRDTDWNEIELLLQRCKGSYDFYGLVPLYCIANIEVLQNEVQFKLVEELQSLKRCKEFLLAVICRGSKNHPFVDQLNDCVVKVQPVSDQVIKNLFCDQFPNVFTYTSDVAGLGKTTTICKQAMSAGRSTALLHISGQLRKSMLVANLSLLKIRVYHTLHLDVGAVDEPGDLDSFLFELVVMRFVASGKLAFYLPTEHVLFEIGNTINNTLRNSLKTVTSFQREHLLWNDFADFTCSMELNSPVQVVCHYMGALDRGDLDKEEIRFSGAKSVNTLKTEECRMLLQKHMNITTDISFAMVHIFLNVLSEQLKKFSCSSFFKVARISEMIGKDSFPTVRSNLVKAMIDVSKEFATRSVNACRSTQSSTVAGQESEVRKQPTDVITKIIDRTNGMIRWEESNHLIYVFHNQNIHTLSPMYRDRAKVPAHVQKLFESQMKRSLQDFSAMKQVELQNMLQRVARTRPNSLTQKQLSELSKNYALTPDNLLKMVLIMMRIQSKVPVVIMGETGCGKTSLIRYLASICEVSFTVMNIHAGVGTSEIIETVMQENTKCRHCKTEQRWLFLDEINTSENIGVICDIICHHKYNGCVLSPNLVIMGACNPYKLRTIDAIHTAGLTSKIKTDDLSKLVYRVLPLPEMMVDYVWDFGSLSEKDEYKYILRMVEGISCFGTAEQTLFADLLSLSQTFVREIESSNCAVSLRDVQRCKMLVPWFVSILQEKPIKGNSKGHPQVGIKIKAIILTLAHCYHSRFMDKSVRTQYRQKLLEGFYKNNFCKISKNDDLHNIIREEQKDILDRMVLPPGTAKNTALQENVFVILVCILNRIPVFVVGKPGCSKSLAMQVIRSNLRGKDSTDVFFRSLPQLYCVSFQGSESSTSDGILKVFEKAENYLKSNSLDSVLPVVILDEIGLAEISRFNPLKVLHNLLEPDGRSCPNVAVVGISNWALDASKMNRAIHLSRPDMDEEELFETAMSIGKSFIDSVEVQEGLSWNEKKTTITAEDLKQELQLIANTYSSYTHKLQFKSFHGLRDFYSLVKFIARTLGKDCMNLTQDKKSAVVVEGLLRNFGGLKSGPRFLLEHFKDCFQSDTQLSLSSVELIQSNLKDTMARHLMVITKGDSVLSILEHNLKGSGREKREIIFGSHFEEDLTDDYNYRILSRIILCMEQGIVLLLKDLENIYGSLYDMLNQNYTRIGKKNNCRVALGPYSNPFCHVADSFRCIVLVDENRVDYTDPPFLNRFEKQFLSFSDVLCSEEEKLVIELKSWLCRITAIEGKPFTKYSALPFYNEELIVSLVLRFSRKLDQSELSILEKCRKELFWILKPEVIVRLPHVEDVSIQLESNVIKENYFQLPLHDGLESFIQHQASLDHEDSLEKLTIVFTYSNIHTPIINELTNWKCQLEKLGAFKSEKQLSVRLQQFWNSTDMHVLLVQCCAQEDDRHIMLTKSLIEKYRLEYLEKHKGECLKFVYLVIHVGCRDLSEASQGSAKSFSQINFLSGWKLVLLENLECQKLSLPVICSRSLLQTVEGMLSDCLKEELFWAFTRIQYGPLGRNMQSINCVIEKIHNSESFLRILGEMIWLYIQDRSTGDINSDWYVNVACDTQALNTSTSLIDALERHARRVIKCPLAMAVFKLEHLGAIDSYFIGDSYCMERREVWCSNIKNEYVFSYTIKGQPINEESGPECFRCDTPDLCLRLPFSRVVYESIEETKGLFTEEVARSKMKCELDPDDILPEEVMEEIILQQESYVLKNVANLIVSDMNEYLQRDYIDDFCNLYSYSFTSSLDKERRTEYMQWLLKQKVSLNVTDNIQFFTRIHCTGWTHLPLFGSAVSLLELYTDIFWDENSQILLEFEAARCKTSLFGDISLENKLEEQEENDYQNISKCLDSHEEEGMLANSDIFDVPSDNALHESEQSLESEVNVSEALCDVFQHNESLCKESDVNQQGGMSAEAFNVMETFVLNNQYPHSSQPDEMKMDFHYKEIEEKEMNIKQDTQDTLSALEQRKPLKLKDFGTMESEKEISDVQASELVCDDSSTSASNVKKISFENTHMLDEDEYKIDLKWSDDMIQDLVSFICAKIIPTTKVMMQFTDTMSWQVAVKNILVLAAEVSTDSEILHALRLCSDIVSDLVIPYDLDLALLHNIGHSLTNETIDSEIVVSQLMRIFKGVTGPGSSVHIQRTVCQYLIRCLNTDTDTKAYIYLFKAVEDKSIPEEEIHLLKPPLNFIIQQNLDENVWIKVIESGPKLETKIKDLDESKHLFVCSLHNCLSTLFMQDRRESPFILMIVDILEETFGFSEEKNNFELMLSCGKIIQDSEVGLPFCTAIAFLRTAVLHMTCLISNEDTDTSALLTSFNAVLSGLGDKAVHKTLLEYFLKGIGQNAATHTVMKHCQNLSATYPFVKTIEWTEGYLIKSVEGNPLVLHVPTRILKFGKECFATNQTTEVLESRIKKLIDLESEEGRDGLLLLYSVLMQEFYLPRYRGMLNDTVISHANLVWTLFDKEKYSGAQCRLVECLLGKRDFMCSHFLHGEESTFQQYMINSILVSTLALSLCEDACGQNLPFLIRVLLKPLELKNFFLAGFPDSSEPVSYQEKNTGTHVFALCECGKRLSFKNTETKRECICGREIQEEYLQVKSNKKTTQHDQSTPGYTYRPYIIRNELSVRNMSDISSNILQLLVKGCILGSIALGLSEQEIVAELVSDTSLEQEPTDQLLAEINYHWKKGKEMLNMDDHDLGILLHSVLKESRQVLFEDRNPLSTSYEMSILERKFDSIVLRILESPFQTIQATIRNCNDLYNLPNGSVEVVIREANDIQVLPVQCRLEQLPSLFRRSSRPTKSDFLCQLWTCRESFKFLTVSIEHERMLVLPKHIYQILQWHMATVVNLSYTLKRHRCLKLTVGEFHDHLGDLSKRKLSRKKFENFKHSWNVLKEALENSEEFASLVTINSDTKMEDCLILDTDGDIYRVLKFLISIQNDFMDLALSLAFSCENLQHLLRSSDVACFKVIQVTELKKNHLIQTSFDWNESLAQESNSCLAYGLGKRISYDFHNIERELAVDLLVGKAFLNLDALQTIVFTDELYRSFVSLLEDVAHSIPQDILPSDINNALVKTSINMANMSLELINHLDMILTLLKKTKCDPQKPLIEFVEERSNILGQKFPSQYLPSPESRIKLCHIVSLHELLEELSVDRIIGTLSDEYNTELDVEIHQHFSEMPISNLKKAALVCQTLKKFVYRCIFMGDMDPEQPLLQTISEKSFWPLKLFDNGKLKIDDKYEDVKEIIPPNMLVCHAAAAVIQLSERIEAQKKDELRMDTVITSWKSKGESVSNITRQKKAVKKLRKS